MGLPATVLRKIGGRLARMGGRSRMPLRNAVPPEHPTEFDPDTLPWLDRGDTDISAYVAALSGDRQPDDDLAEKLEHWRRLGYVILPGLISESLIDAYRADVDELVADRSRYRTRVLLEGIGIKPISDTTLEQLRHPHVRIMDFHNQSVAAKKIILHSTIVRFVEHLFREPVVAMQTLTFWRGSEQWTHQDYAYVVSQIPSHLCAAWIALEDVDTDAAPLAHERIPCATCSAGVPA